MILAKAIKILTFYENTVILTLVDKFILLLIQTNIQTEEIIMKNSKLLLIFCPIILVAGIIASVCTLNPLPAVIDFTSLSLCAAVLYALPGKNKDSKTHNNNIQAKEIKNTSEIDDGDFDKIESLDYNKTGLSSNQSSLENNNRISRVKNNKNQDDLGISL